MTQSLPAAVGPLVRQADSADIGTVQAVTVDAFSRYTERIGRPPAPMANDYVTLIRESRVWVAELDGEVVGVLVLDFADDHVVLDTIAVAWSMQGRGVGGQLLHFTDEQARAAGLPEVRLCTNEAMTENLAYYPRRGYRETHRALQNGYRRVFYVKQLSTAADR